MIESSLVLRITYFAIFILFETGILRYQLFGWQIIGYIFIFLPFWHILSFIPFKLTLALKDLIISKLKILWINAEIL